MRWWTWLWLLFQPPDYGIRISPGFGRSPQDWGLEETRSGASMFWWLYFVHPPGGPPSYDVVSRPLVVWLDGGPGDGGSGSGNFLQIGPLHLNGTIRETSWVNDFNVLYIDAPAGSGFSRISPNGQSPTGKNEALDVRDCLLGFLNTHKEFREVPMYIFGHSYGGKLAVKVAELAISSSGLPWSNLKGVGLSSPYISPADTSWTLRTFYNERGYLNATQNVAIDKIYKLMRQNLANQKWTEAFNGMAELLGMVSKHPECRDLETVYESVERKFKDFYDSDQINDFMNTKVKPAIGVPRTYGVQTMEVYNATLPEFMKPMISSVRNILKNSDLKMIILSGGRDGLIPASSTATWVDKVFENEDGWMDDGWVYTQRAALVVDNVIEAYGRRYKDFTLYFFPDAGHLVTRDSGKAVRVLLNIFTDTQAINYKTHN
ncbi:retinoid-inducible serine carboxypeptidase-like [Diachasmimorpha longicaudata]|uniref:retinoid-inducible serine carboxypeptidase-like n=1 Tax=Diachasmimorpha longicaudata TaxID=58733 RepID=UPI0030B899CA